MGRGLVLVGMVGKTELCYNASMSFPNLLAAQPNVPTTAFVLVAVAAVASFDLFLRLRGGKTHLAFACIFGSVISVGLIKLLDTVLQPGLQENSHAMALAFLLLLLGWRALFGPWEAPTKATVLGTLVFWAGFVTVLRQPEGQRMVTMVAALVALVPAGIWALLFLRYHAERFSAVLVMFFSGMLSTFPILLYDAFVRHGVELQFFLLRVSPESFSSASRAFVSGQLADGTGVRTAVIASLLSFVIVGLIEEASKFWVVRHGGSRLFSSIDDALQLSIIVAIGFAFAENVINPSYFPAFVQEYLMRGNLDVVGFLGNVLGRSVLTSMVHIVSTGVCGYFFGLAIFAGPYLRERKAQGRAYRLLAVVHRLMGWDETTVFRTQMLVTGLLSAVALHGAFNFLVTLPDMLPGRPTTVAEVLGMAPDSVLGYVPFLLVPSLFYVVGGFWLLTMLFLRKESMEERGRMVPEYVVAPVDGIAG